jgi:hypothetical protein
MGDSTYDASYLIEVHPLGGIHCSRLIRETLIPALFKIRHKGMALGLLRDMATFTVQLLYERR